MAPNSSARRSSAPAVWRRLPIVLSLLAVVAIGVAYYMYVRSRTAYLVGRDTRLLSSVAAQLNEALRANRTIVKNFAQSNVWGDGTVGEAPIRSYRRPEGTNDHPLRDYVGVMEKLERDVDKETPTVLFTDSAKAEGLKKPLTAEHVEDRLVRENGRLTLQIEYQDVEPAGRAAAGHAPLPISPKVRPHAMGSVSFSSIVDNIFNQGFLGGFDAIMLVRGDGLVLYEVQPDESYSRTSGVGPLPRVNGRTTTAPDIIITSLQSLKERTGFTSEAPLSIKALRTQTLRTEVTLGGRSYVLMTQPYPFDTARSDSIASAAESKDDAAGSGDKQASKGSEAKGDGQKKNGKDEKDAQQTKHTTRDIDEWMIAGLVGRTRFMTDATSISTSLVALISALLILAACCLPFLKIVLLNESQPVTRTDVALIILSVLLGSGLATIVFVDSIAYKRLSADADDQQRAYASDMTTRLYRGVDKMINVADGLQRWSVDFIKQRWAEGQKDLASVPDVNEQLDEHDYPDVYQYPWFSSFAWIDSNGRHVFRGAMKGGAPPLLNVSGRAYFQNVIDHPFEWHTADQKNPVTRKVYFESVRTMTTGRPETVIAVPVDRLEVVKRLHPEYPAPLARALAPYIPPVFSVTFRFIEFSASASPPAMSFAIIDDAGNVLYHSDQRRIGLENVYAETDNARRLRAAVLARHDEFVDTAYWGEDQRILVTPLRDMPWTLLTFRNKRLLRTVNLEMILITVLLLGMNLLFWATIFLLVGLFRPQYRAAWLWPHQSNAVRWRRLLIILSITIAAALLVLFFYDLPARLAIGFVAPVQVVLASYLVLSVPPRRYTYLILGAFWLFATGVLIWLASFEELQHEMLFGTGAFARLPVIVLICAAAVLVAVPVNPKPVSWRSFVREYTVCGVLAVLLVGVLPATSFFHTAHRIKMESLIKYGQLVLAERIEQRLDDLAHESWSSHPEESIACWFYVPYFYDSVFQPAQCSTPDCKTFQPFTPAQPKAHSPAQELPRDTTVWKSAHNRVAELIDEILPQYSDDSLAMRDLYHGGASDGAWQWRQNDRVLAFIRPFVRMGEASRGRLFNDVSGRMIVITSRLPRLLPADMSPQDAIGPYGGPRPVTHVENSMPRFTSSGAAVAGAIGLLLLAAHIVRVIGRRIFVYDLRPPEWLTLMSPPLRDPVADNLFIVRSATRAVGDIVERRGSHVVLFSQIEKDKAWQTALYEIDSVPAGRMIICEDFESVMTSSNTSAKALSFLEKLVQLPNRTVIVVSSISPSLVPVSGSSSARWTELMTSFITIDERQLLPLPVLLPPAPRLLAEVTPKFLSEEYWENDWALFVTRLKAFRRHLASYALRMDADTWLKQEAGTHNHLAVLVNEIKPETGATVDEIADEFSERATSYYTALWRGCSPSEKLLLHQIAQYGFVNGTNRRLLRRLMARGLVRREADIRLFNDSFRCFVLTRHEDVAEEMMAAEEHGAWDRLRVPLLVVFLASTAFFFATQKDLVNATSAILTGLAAGLPALLKLVGLFTDRRGAVATPQ